MVGYTRGAVLTYSLNAHSPWEGYRVSVNGTDGRAELEVVERAAVLPDPDGRLVLDASSVTDDGGRRGGALLTVQKHWAPAKSVPIPEATEGGHGGGDALLLADVFRGATADPLGRQAGYRDGLASVAVGLAANTSMATGRPVRIEEMGLPALEKVPLCQPRDRSQAECFPAAPQGNVTQTSHKYVTKQNLPSQT